MSSPLDELRERTRRAEAGGGDERRERQHRPNEQRAHIGQEQRQAEDQREGGQHRAGDPELPEGQPHERVNAQPRFPVAVRRRVRARGGRGVRGTRAIWGRETDVGRYALPYDTLRVVATQAYVGRRKDQYRTEFILALKILNRPQRTLDGGQPFLGGRRLLFLRLNLLFGGGPP